jgi:GGDEF domain-containing protein
MDSRDHPKPRASAATNSLCCSAGNPPTAHSGGVCACTRRRPRPTRPLRGLDLNIPASIGTAQAQAGDTIEDLMHRADTAMYADKTRVDRRASAAPRSQPAAADKAH